MAATRMTELGLDDGGSLRRLAARGSVVNALFTAGLSGIGAVRALVVAAFVSAADYGIFGLLLAAYALLAGLRAALVSDPYVRQDVPDQERAFHAAFALAVVADLVLVGAIVAAVPLLALVTGRTELVGPGLALALVVPGLALQAPTLVLYRRMRFARLRLVQAVDPLVSFAVMVALAVAGAGVWALVAGLVAGAWAGAAAALLAAPIRLRLRWDGAVARAAVAFAWPSVLGVLSGTGIGLGTALVGEAALGLAGVGAITFAAIAVQWVERVDGVLSQTLYPAICAVRERRELLVETFAKSNRVALMWGAPVGLGLALFAEPLVRDVLGPQWIPAIGLVQAFGVLAAVNQVGFNWGAYCRALGDTRPIALVAAVSFALSCAVTFPLLAVYGLPGLAVGVGVVSAVALVLRWVLLRRVLGTGLRPWRHGARGLAPAAAAAALVLVVPLPALPELALFALACGALTWWWERALIREALGYLR